MTGQVRPAFRNRSRSLDVPAIAERIVPRVEAVGHKVPAVVDCSDFRVLSDLEDACWRMWKDVAEPRPSSTTRNAVQAFLRARLDEDQPSPVSLTSRAI